MMSEEDRAKMLDSLSAQKAAATDDMLDSIGRSYGMMDDMGSELFKPKISLRAPLMLSSNLEIMSGRFTITPKNGALEFEPSKPYGEITVSSEPIRQRFKLAMPEKRSFTEEERVQWRSVLGWCDECEQNFLNSPAKQRSENIIFHQWPNKTYLIEVDCGVINGNKARMFFTLADKGGMPSVAVHQFEQGFYIDDPSSELRRGYPRVLSERADLLVGKIAYDKMARTITVERATAKETYGFYRGFPDRIKASYKDRSGKWRSLDDVYQSSLTMDANTCATAAPKSHETEMDRTTSGYMNEGD
jgi:hypothetical protein